MSDWFVEAANHSCGSFPPEVDEMATAGLGFESPFEDELDTPAFLRRGSGSHVDDDRDVPAFMRRGSKD